MAAFFTIGEQKTRPGVYFRYENHGDPPSVGADNGRCAAVLRSNWGPLGEVVVLENYEDVAKVFGNKSAGCTSAVAYEQFMGGAGSVHAVRIGSGGTKGTYEILDNLSTPVIKLTMLYPGSRSFSFTIRPSLEDTNLGEALLIENTNVLEKFTFDISPGADQVMNLLNAVFEKGSKYFSLSKLNDSSEALKIVDQDAITPGTDPLSYDPAAYSAAFEALEAFRWNVLSLDTDDSAIQVLMQGFLKRIYNNGRFVMGVVGENKSVPFDTRLVRSASFNDYQIVYVGNGFVDSMGNIYDGYLAAARVAGMIAGTPSNESVTHTPVTGAVSLSEALTNYQYEQAIKAGMLTFSTSAANTVWVEQGINTLVMPGTKEDAGWKKIKRVKIRFELMQRLNDTVEGLIGRVNNDSDGRLTIVQACNGVCNSMVAERKLLAGAYCIVDPDNAPAGDSAWFLVYADDVDAMEKMYFTFKFRFAPGEVSA